MSDYHHPEPDEPSQNHQLQQRLEGEKVNSFTDRSSSPYPSPHPSFYSRKKFSLSLAPMVRASTTPLRTLALKYGADYVYSEELVDKSISGTERIVNSELGTIDYVKVRELSAKQLSNKNRRKETDVIIFRMDPIAEKDRLVFQIGCGSSLGALHAAQTVEKDVCAIDINMGCPKSFSTSGGMGSRLLQDVEKASDIVKTLVRNMSVPISCKIRLLGDPKDSDSKLFGLTLEFMKALEFSGASAITLHARTVKDSATDLVAKPRWPLIKDLVNSLNCKVIVNGDVYTYEDVLKVQEQTNANGVMLARSALWNASIFRKSQGLLSCDQVLKDYLVEAYKYNNHFVNTKYVACEFSSNRRHPPNNNVKPNVYASGLRIADFGSLRTMDELCNLWDVNLSGVRGNGGGKCGDNLEALGGVKYSDDYFQAEGGREKIERADDDVDGDESRKKIRKIDREEDEVKTVD